GGAEQKPHFRQDGIRAGEERPETDALVGGKRDPPGRGRPGGVSAPLTEDRRDTILAKVPEAIIRVRRTLDWYKEVFGHFDAEIRTFANFPSLFMGLVTDDGELEMYDGKLRFIDATGRIIADKIEPNKFGDYIEEAVEPDSYLKSPYYKALGYPDGIYRVGPLARLNLIDRIGTPMADEEWAEFRMLERGASLSSFQYHYARLIEMLYCVEKIDKLLNSPDILSDHIRAKADPNSLEGIGVSEAPRGTLMHHYKIDRQGMMVWANLIIATGHNSLAMNKGVYQVARYFVHGEKIEEGMLNRVEAVIRTFDPCLSCSTHAFGQMPLRIELRSPDGELLDEVRQG
ncbi:MAG: Ni/Fe hydrogenase subunit alpha, partial [Candidatus Promineofilum sp.]|nr:Ni/Fe hydrogenase subunit alpha [Promineifilum sp.]